VTHMEGLQTGVTGVAGFDGLTAVAVGEDGRLRNLGAACVVRSGV
jgi:hypothetical protein